MENNENNPNQDNRYVTFWLLFLTAAVIVIVGWLFMVKFNFQSINKTMTKNGLTTEQAIQEMQNVFSEAREVLDNAGEEIKTAMEEEEKAKAQEQVIAGEEQKAKTETVPAEQILPTTIPESEKLTN
ncbi:MAG: hypothetical protein WCT18_02770 [Patescibacteria group bacterium]